MALIGQVIRKKQTELAALALLLAVDRVLQALPADSIEGLLETLTEGLHDDRA